MALRKILGIETEYGILLRGRADANPIAASSMLINAYMAQIERGSTSGGTPGLAGTSWMRTRRTTPEA